MTKSAILSLGLVLVSNLAHAQALPDLPPLNPNDGIKDKPGKAVVVKEKKKTASKKAAKAKAAEKAKAAARAKPWPKDAKTSTHIIASGGSLSKVSELAYGRTRYWRILKLYNGVDPSKLKVGQEILAPELPWLLDASGLTGKYPKVSAGILKVHNKLKALEDAEGKLGEAQQTELLKLVNDLTQIKKALQAKTEGVDMPPAATIKQIVSARKHIIDISAGNKSRLDRQALAHEHLSNAIVYGVLWARDGFK